MVMTDVVIVARHDASDRLGALIFSQLQIPPSPLLIYLTRVISLPSLCLLLHDQCP